MRRLTSGAVLALLYTLACAPSPAGGLSQTATLAVDNQSWSLVSVAQLCEGMQRGRLGDVEAVSSAVWRLPLCTGGSAAFQLRPLAGYATTTEAILYQPGDTVGLTIPNGMPAFLYLRPRREP